MFRCASKAYFLLRHELIRPPSAAHPSGSAIMISAGFGFQGRLRGLSIDALVEAEVVLADGSIAVINKQSHPGEWRYLLEIAC